LFGKNSNNGNSIIISVNKMYVYIPKVDETSNEIIENNKNILLKKNVGLPIFFRDLSKEKMIVWKKK
jgi:DUF2075 family protein